MSDVESLMILWNIATKSTFILVGMVWTVYKEFDWNNLNVYSETP